MNLYLSQPHTGRELIEGEQRSPATEVAGCLSENPPARIGLESAMTDFDLFSRDFNSQARLQWN